MFPLYLAEHGRDSCSTGVGSSSSSRSGECDDTTSDKKLEMLEPPDGACDTSKISVFARPNDTKKEDKGSEKS